MKKILKFICFIVIVSIIIWIGISILNYEKINNNTFEIPDSNNEEVKLNTAVVINRKDGKETVSNFELVEEFLDKVGRYDTVKEKISLKILEENEGNTIEKELIFTPGSNNFKENADLENENSTEKTNTAFRYDNNISGYYTIKSSDNEELEKETFNAMLWYPEMKTKDGKVELILYSYADVTEFPIIATFDLENTSYKKIVDLNYFQRKDLGINEVASKEDNKYGISVYTYGGNVDICVEGDMVYTLENALKEEVITIDDIIDQAKLDAKFGICEIGYYSDGGSTEYLYPEYTILKFGTLDGNKDLVIGFNGQIINKFTKSLEQQNNLEHQITVGN